MTSRSPQKSASPPPPYRSDNLLLPPKQKKNSNTNMSVDGGSSGGKKLPSLGSLLGRSKSPGRNKGSAATVQGDRNLANSDPEGEVVMRDGKKVRIVKKRVTRKKSGSGTDTSGEGEVYVRPDGKRVRRVVKRSKSSVTAASDSITQSTAPFSSDDEHAEGTVYINSQGKKVRRVRKPVGRATSSASLPAASSSMPSSGPLAAMARAVTPKKKKGGALSGFLSQSSGDESDKASAADGAGTVVSEVYLNKDGKKVRRVRRKKPAAGSAATVTGSPPARSTSSGEQGEIYVRPDGKKVRRVKRSTSSVSAAPKAGGLGGFLGNEKKMAPKTSAATVTGGETSTRSDVYINASGKRVRRVRKQKSTQSMSPGIGSATQTILNERANVDKKPAAATLGSMLGSNNATSKPGASGSATVAAAGPQEGEIYIRADGKKVRRTRRVKKAPALGGFLKNDGGDNAKAMSGSATVAAGDFEIVVRPDGKKVKRRLKQKKGGTAADDKNSDYKVYRRESDGKLVRRVRRTTSSASVPAAGGKGSATAAGKPAAKLAAAALPKKEEKTPAPTKGPTLTSEEESIATDYRKMKKMGLPDDAVRHKMQINEVHGKIQAAVLGEDYVEPPPAPPVPPKVQLSEDEEAMAGAYRTMVKMGLPEGAVRHKMEQSDVHPKVIASVFGESWTEEDETKLAEAKKKKEEEPEAPAPAAVEANTPSSGLTEEEDAIAAQYIKMQKMGLPIDVVRHKMIVSEVSPTIMAAVLGEEGGGREAPSKQNSGRNLSASEETIAAQYRKMLKMGMPEDAVRHKMVLGEEDPKIIAAVFGESNEGHEKPAAAKPTPEPEALTAEEEGIAAQYRKMQKMGLPDDAVRHKMIVGEVDPKIITAVFDGPPPATPAAPNAVAYVVVVGDEPVGAQSTASDDGSVTSLNPDEKFAVKVNDGGSATSPTKTTKFYTLSELSKLSGQSKSELEAVVSDKRKRGASPPRFSLQPLDERKYEVAVPKDGGSKPPAPAAEPSNAMPAGMDPKLVKEVKDGQEVVDSDLAKTARAVNALGQGDMSALLAKLEAGDMKDLLEKLQEAEKRQKKLEKQLAQAGVAIAEDIEYMEAKVQVERIAKRMGEIGGSDVTAADKDEQNKLREEYFKLEQQMERFNTALMLTEEYQAEQDRIERKWEEDNEPGNLAAVKKLRRHMPVNIRNLSEAELTTTPSPNGKYLPKAIAKKFKRTNILQCLRLNPDDLECMHPATLENMRVTGLTLTERRALYYHFKPIGPKWEKNKAEKMTERKWTWYQMMKSNFKENLAPYQRHVAQYGPPENHPYATRDNPNAGCPMIGKQCPVKADKLIDYDNDYGWTDAAEFEVSEVRKADVEDSGAKAMAEALELAKEKKQNERADLLKKHYKGKLLQVSKANGSCEAMDESMDNMENHTMKWIEWIIDKGDSDTKKEVANFVDALNEFKLKVIDFGGRSGMQMSGKKKAGGGKADIRSAVEASLSEEVFECANEMFAFVRKRMKDAKVTDTRAGKTIEMLEGMLNELHGRNIDLLQKLGVKRRDRSRKLKTNADLKKEVEDKRKPKEEEAEPEAASGPPPGGPGRGGLLGDIAGRGRGGGGRGGLMDAISGRGKKGPGGGGRGGLMDAIAGRGKGGRGGRGGGGGRGDLLGAIAGRGRGRGGGGGGRGGLMAAIAARGGG